MRDGRAEPRYAADGFRRASGKRVTRRVRPGPVCPGGRGGERAGEFSLNGVVPDWGAGGRGVTVCGSRDGTVQRVS